MSPRIRSVRTAANFVDRAGLALAFPSEDLVLPSLWEAMTGKHEIEVFEQDERGRNVLTPEMERVWEVKNGLAEDRMACVGKHVRGRLALLSLDILPAAYSVTGRRGRPDDFRQPGVLSPLELDLAEALLDSGPRTGPQLRHLLGLRDARASKRALESLQRLLVVTQAGEAEQDQGWAAAVFDLTARRFPDRLRRLPSLDQAREELCAAVLRSSAEVSAADVAACLGMNRKEAALTLDRLVDEGLARRREEGGLSLWRHGQRERRT